MSKADYFKKTGVLQLNETFNLSKSKQLLSKRLNDTSTSELGDIENK